MCFWIWMLRIKRLKRGNRNEVICTTEDDFTAIWLELRNKLGKEEAHMDIIFLESYLWRATLDPKGDLRLCWAEGRLPWEEHLLLCCACEQTRCGSLRLSLSASWAWRLKRMWNQEWSLLPLLTADMQLVCSQPPWRKKNWKPWAHSFQNAKKGHISTVTQLTTTKVTPRKREVIVLNSLDAVACR